VDGVGIGMGVDKTSVSTVEYEVVDGGADDGSTVSTSFNDLMVVGCVCCWLVAKVVFPPSRIAVEVVVLVDARTLSPPAVGIGWAVLRLTWLEVMRCLLVQEGVGVVALL
jgi:hypothetical protein